MNDVIFLHIPKTGGSYTKHGYSKLSSPIRPIKNIRHKFVLDEPEDFDIFCNPIYYTKIKNQLLIKQLITNHI